MALNGEDGRARSGAGVVRSTAGEWKRVASTKYQGVVGVGDGVGGGGDGVAPTDDSCLEAMV